MNLLILRLWRSLNDLHLNSQTEVVAEVVVEVVPFVNVVEEISVVVVDVVGEEATTAAMIETDLTSLTISLVDNGVVVVAAVFAVVEEVVKAVVVGPKFNEDDHNNQDHQETGKNYLPLSDLIILVG